MRDETPDQRHKQWRQKQGRKYRMLQSARHRAKEKGWDYNLDLDDIEIPDRCPVLDIPIEKNPRQLPTSASLHRLDPEKGYIKGSVMVISWRANDLLKNATVDELEKLLEFTFKLLEPRPEENQDLPGG